jgi:dihydrofolate reductase
MGRLIVQEFVSLDGFAADADNQFSFIDTDAGPTTQLDRDTLERLRSVHAILLGAQTYREFVEYWPTSASAGEPLAPRINALPKFVFSRRLDAAPWPGFDNATVVSSDAGDAIRSMKSELTGDLILWGSLTLLERLFDDDLVDVLRLVVVPVVLGAGRSVFPPTVAGVRLSLTRSASYDGRLVELEYATTR